jgi:hypothetical protein
LVVGNIVRGSVAARCQHKSGCRPLRGWWRLSEKPATPVEACEQQENKEG